MIEEWKIVPAVRVLKANVGANNKNFKLRDYQIREIRILREEGLTLAKIATQYNCSFQHVSDIALCKRRVAV